MCTQQLLFSTILGNSHNMILRCWSHAAALFPQKHVDLMTVSSHADHHKPAMCGLQSMRSEKKNMHIARICRVSVYVRVSECLFKHNFPRTHHDRPSSHENKNVPVCSVAEKK